MDEEISIDNFENFYPLKTPRFTERASVEALKQTGIDPKELKPITEEQLKKFPAYPGVRESVEKTLNQRRMEKINQIQYKRGQILNALPSSKRSDADTLAELRKKAESKKGAEEDSSKKLVETIIVNELALLEIKESQEEREKRRLKNLEQLESELNKTRREKYQSINERSNKVKLQNKLEQQQRDKKRIEMEEKWENESRKQNDEEQKRKAAERRLIEMKRKEATELKILRKQQMEEERMKKLQEKLQKEQQKTDDLSKTKPEDAIGKKLKIEEEAEAKKKQKEKEEKMKKQEQLNKIKKKEEEVQERLEKIRKEKVNKFEETRSKSIEKMDIINKKQKETEKNQKLMAEELLKKDEEMERKKKEKSQPPEEQIIEQVNRELKAQFVQQNLKEKERGQKYMLKKKQEETEQRQQKVALISKTRAEITAELRSSTLKNAETRRKMIEEFNYIASRSDNPDFSPLVAKYGLNIDELKAEAKKKHAKIPISKLYEPPSLEDELDRLDSAYQQSEGVAEKSPSQQSSARNENPNLPDGSSFNLFENPDEQTQGTLNIEQNLPQLEETS